MDFRRLNDADLADFTKNVAIQLTGHSVSGIDNALADDLAATLSPLHVTFNTAVEDSVESTAVKQSATADKQALRDDILTRLATVRNYLVAAATPRGSFERCGFTFPETGGFVTANDPTDLTAVGTSNGVNRLTFSGNNRSGSVTYEIWRLKGDTAPFAIIGTTKRQVYIDTPVTPGEYYNYKVRAIAAKSMSNFSNTAVVYGAL